MREGVGTASDTRRRRRTNDVKGERTGRSGRDVGAAWSRPAGGGGARVRVSLRGLNREILELTLELMGRRLYELRVGEARRERMGCGDGCSGGGGVEGERCGSLLLLCGDWRTRCHAEELWVVARQRVGGDAHGEVVEDAGTAAEHSRRGCLVT